MAATKKVNSLCTDPDKCVRILYYDKGHPKNLTTLLIIVLCEKLRCLQNRNYTNIYTHKFLLSGDNLNNKPYTFLPRTDRSYQ